MKSLVLIFGGLLIATTVLAQHGEGGHSGGGHSGAGHSGGSSFHGGGSVAGHGGYGGYGGYGRSVVVPYAVPFYGYGYGAGYYAPPAYGSGYTDPGYGYAAPPPPDQPMDYGPDGGQPAPPPPADDNSLQVYQAPAPTPQEAAMSEGRYYLIAYKDHSVYTALAFWMENGVLNYVTPQNTHNQVSLDRLDLDLTKQLNARRGMPFNIMPQ